MDVESLAKQLILQNMTPEQQKAVLESVRATLQEARGKQKQRVSENVGLVVDALKKIESDIRAKYDDLGNKITTRVNSIRDGRDGANGSDGRDGQDGRPGRDGAQGPAGPAGRDGVNGVDGVDGVSVTDARIDFDGSLIISLSNGREINVGEVVAADLAEKIKVITNGGGTSQYVLDTLASLQTQINNLIPSQTGNAGKFLTTNGSSLSWAQVAGGLSYQGTWNASTNTPTLTSGVGSNGYYYVVATAGSTNLDGITDWQIGDWLLFNGTTWQKIDQSELVTSVASADASVTVTTTGPAVDLAVYSSPRLIMQVRNETGSTLTKGTVVYINGAAGNKATVTKAIATGDTTSAQTLGLIAADISTNNNGFAIISGEIAGLDTSAFAAGVQLYLSSTTAGAYTSTKQYAPNHLVYVGVVTRSHANQGTIEVRIQNGYEMDELHNVSAQSPSNGQVLIYNASTSLWEKNTLTDGTGITITEGAGSITIANSGVTSAVAGTGISVSGSTGAVTITNTAPDQTVALTGAGTTSVTGTYPNFTVTSNDQYTGTVTSVSGTGTVNGLSLSGTVTSSGSLTLGGTLSGTASININGTVGATTPAAGTFTDLTANNSAVISVNTSGDALRITQTGTGNALLVEDSANPDSTPFVVDANGNLVVGHTSPIAAGQNTNIQSHATGGSAGISAFRWSDNTIPPRIQIGKSRGASVGTNAIVQSGDQLGGVYFYGDDGTDLVTQGASIIAEVDGTPGTNDMPGRLIFSTTADGTSSPTERMCINSSGNVGIGTTAPLAGLNVNGAGGELIRISVNPDAGVIQEPALGFATGVTNTHPAAKISALEFDASDSRASLLFYTRDSNSDIAPTERMRINNIGHVKITNPTGANGLEIDGSAYTASPRLFFTNDTSSSAMYLNASEELLFTYSATPGSSSGTVGLKMTSSGGFEISRTAVTSPAATDGNVFSGTYSPALTNTTNITSSTPATCQYMRVGNVVTVSGTVTIDPTATGRIVMGMTLPIASNFAGANECGGTFASSGTTTVNVGSIAANSTNDRATFDGVTADAASRVYAFSFTYLVI